MNAPMDTMKRSLWHRATSYVLTLFMMLQLTIPSVAAAMTSASNGLFQQELSAEQLFARSAIQTYLYERSKYIPKPPGNYANQTIEEFHSVLQSSYLHRVPSEIAIDWIPIAGNITFFVPQERTIYPLNKLVGDSFVQRKLIGSQIKRLIGRTYYKTTFTSEQAQISQLYANAKTVASKSTFKYRFGDTLPEGIADTMKADFIWPERRSIGGEYVLVPVVHLQKATVEDRDTDGQHTVEFRKSNATFKSAQITNADIKLQRDTVFTTINDLVIGSKSSISIDNSASRIYAGVSFLPDASGKVQGVATGTLYNYGQINSERNVDIVAGNYVQKTFVHRFKTVHGYSDYLGSIASINAGGSISIKTYGDMEFAGATANANGGSITLSADGNIMIGAVKLQNAASFKIRGGHKTKNGTNYIQSMLTAKDNISLYASGIIEIIASELHADKGVIEILSDNGIYILNEFDEYSGTMDRKWGKTTETEQEFETIAIRSVLDAGKGIVISSEYGDITLKATKITSTQGAEIDAYNGKVHLLLAKQQDHYFYNKVKKGFWKIKTETKQDTVDTAIYNDIIGGVRVNATAGLTLELGQYQGESIADVVNGLSSTKSLSWMADIYNDPKYACPPQASVTTPDGFSDYAYAAIEADPDFKQCNSLLDVVYTKLEKVHKHEKTSNLSPAAMAIIAIAVSVAMGPAGANWIGAEGAIAQAVGQGTFSAAALSAGAATLATQAATSIANGEGIDGAIKSITESDNLRSLAISMVTAGLLQELEGIKFFDKILPDAAIANADELISIGNQAAQVVVSSAVRAGVETLISGKSLDTLGNAFVNSLKLQAINEVGKGIAQNIEKSSFNEAMKYIAHAATGCLLASVQSTSGSKSQDCAAGASGSVAAKFVASQYDPQVDKLTKEGEDVAAWLQKHVGVDAAGMSEEEIKYYYENKTISPSELYHWTRLREAISELNTLQAQSADITRLIAGLSAFVAKGTANAINSAANNGQAISQGSTFRTMSLEYRRAVVLLGALEEYELLQAAFLETYTVGDLLKDGVKLPSAFDDITLANTEISGAEATLLHDIAVMEILSTGTPVQKAKLVEEYGTVVATSFNNLDSEIIHFNWKEFGQMAAAAGAVNAFIEMKLTIDASNMNEVKGIDAIREIFQHRWNRYVEYLPLIEALEEFGAAALIAKLGTKVVKEALKRTSREGIVRRFIHREEKNFVRELVDDAEYLLKHGDGQTPLVKNRTAIAKAFIPGSTVNTKTEAFFNFTGKASGLNRIVLPDGSNGIKWGSEPQTLIITDHNAYMKLLKKNFYKQDVEPLHPVLETEIRRYLQHAQKHGIAIPSGNAAAPALHAEVRAANAILHKYPHMDPKNFRIATVKLKGDDAGKPFKACLNCTGILDRFKILTGETKATGAP
ncbi:DUF637 domain-containing protein [Pseudoalteromonas obscura]|uniref:DUF637 domain-containing protein n=1 Tax=Pseudoalteromonas obscura TaxID=3048491 RepID=A0ABT7ENP8_9GAMM|nr:DUF637 domain-containing protein [Pseudoalteromonas sp. P94(2023)]MDK2596677.1 DUF637 domain-containing protein [Pseudoalteromonas sp. P94(2023)]